MARRTRPDETYNPSADLDHETEMVSLFGPAAGGVIDAVWGALKRAATGARRRRQEPQQPV